MTTRRAHDDCLVFVLHQLRQDQDLTFKKMALEPLLSTLMLWQQVNEAKLQEIVAAMRTYHDLQMQEC